MTPPAVLGTFAALLGYGARAGVCHRAPQRTALGEDVAELAIGQANDTVFRQALKRSRFVAMRL